MTARAQMRTGWRRAALLLLACALLLKLPAGWMPEASARGISIGWCNAISADAAAEGKKLFESAIAKKQAPKHKPSGDQACPFAAAAQPMTAGDPLPELVAPLPEPLALPSLPSPIPGRGLVAPPPFATGPPLHA